MWQIPGRFPELTTGSIHIWRASLRLEEIVLQRLARHLSAAETVRARRFVFEADQKSFAASHGILRHLLSQYLQCSPQEIQFVCGPYGKPVISQPSPSIGLEFNLSHSNGVVVIGISRERELGVDVEKIRPEFASDEIARRYFSSTEVEDLTRIPPDLRSEAFFRCWTQKEAYVKALGEGLRFPLDSFSVSLTPGEPPYLRAADEARWKILSFIAWNDAEANYMGAIVARGKDWVPEYFEWRNDDADTIPDH